jgi:hypothetical protein
MGALADVRAVIEVSINHGAKGSSEAPQTPSAAPNRAD